MFTKNLPSKPRSRRGLSAVVEALETRELLSSGTILRLELPFEPTAVAAITVERERPAVSTALLAAPVVIGPGSLQSPGPVLSTATPALTWNAVPGASGYQVNLFDETLNQFNILKVAAADTSVTVPTAELKPGDAYIWNVRVMNGTQIGPGSAYLYFVAPAGAPISAPVALSPGNAQSPGPVGSLGGTTFKWGAVAGATGYQINIFDVTQNKNYCYDVNASVSSYSLGAGAMIAGDQFAWNVRAMNGATVGLPSASLYFELPQAPALPAPTLISPGTAQSPGTVADSLTPTFAWSAVKGSIDGYELHLYDQTTGESYSYALGAKATTFTVGAGVLRAGDNFMWELRVVAVGTTGPESSYLYFQAPNVVTLVPPAVTGPGSPQLPGPVLTTRTPKFSWTAVPGVTGYKLNVFDDTNNKVIAYSLARNITHFTMPPGMLKAGHKYAWDLRLLDGELTGPPTAFLYFQV